MPDLLYMFLVVGETGAPGGNLRRHGENMQTPLRKALLRPGFEPRTFLLRSESALSHRAAVYQSKELIYGTVYLFNLSALELLQFFF